VSSHIFVDETKRAGYVIAAVTVSDTEAIRKIVRALVLPGQRRIHMKHEQARRRRVIVSALAAMQVQATVYDAARRYRTDLAARTDMPHCPCRRHRRPRRRYSARDRAGRLRRASPTATTYSSSYARPALLTGSSIATSAPTTSRFLLCRTSWHGAGSAPASGAGGSVRS
jgi:hypothetical protein